MPVTATTYLKVVFIGERHEVLDAKDSRGNKGIFGGILDRLAPVFEGKIGVDLAQSMCETSKNFFKP